MRKSKEKQTIFIKNKIGVRKKLRYYLTNIYKMELAGLR